jgi:hypothetical protein
MKLFKISFILALFIGGVFAGYNVWAQESSHVNIDYPVAELGNCASEQECHAYCDDISNFQSCIAFARANDLLSPKELAEAERFERFGVASGPGECVSEVECNAYCEDISNIEECLAFANEHGVLNEEELEEARKVAAALREGAQLPGGCTNKLQCEVYCQDTNHISECLSFAEAAGFMSPVELEEARKVERALAAGAQLPGGCRGKDECDVYCEDPAHINECLDFAEAAGFIEPEELEEARRFAPLMARGEMPGGCQSREECEQYCSQEDHIAECVEVFESVGVISSKEAEMFRKTGGKGPGGCQGKDECDAYCNNPANQAVCFEFAKDHDLIPEEELAHMQENVQRFREGLESAPPEVKQCLRDRLGADALAKMEGDNFLPNQEMGDVMRQCFEEHLPAIMERDIKEQLGEDAPPGAVDCVRRIIGNGERPTPEQEQRIGRECFPQQPPEGEHDESFPPEGRRGIPQDIPEEFRREIPQDIPEDFRPPEGVSEERFQEEVQRRIQEETQERFQEETQERFQEEFQRQFEEQIQQQIPEDFRPPEGFEQQIPEEFQQFLEQPLIDSQVHQIESLPPEEFRPEESPADEPHEESQARTPRSGFLGAVLDAVTPALKRLLPSLSI